jgi:hypothetical protein
MDQAQSEHVQVRSGKQRQHPPASAASMGARLLAFGCWPGRI